MPVCTTITEWIREEVSKPVEEWEERTKEQCKKRKWYDPRKWLCYLVVYLVKVVRWIVVTVLRAVVSTVCRIIVAVLGFIWDLLRFLGLLIKALVTWDKCTLQEALGMLGNAIIRVFHFLGEVIFQPFGDAVNEFKLRRYVKKKIEARFAGNQTMIDAVKTNLHVDHGVFGYRLNCKVVRLFVDSQTMTTSYADKPNLAGLHHDTSIDFDLYVLAGFHGDTDNCDIFGNWYRPRPQTGTFPFASGGGLGEPEPPPIKRERLKEYIDSNGSKGPHFRIWSMSKDNLDKKLDAAKEKGRQIGLILNFAVEDREVTDPHFMFYDTGNQTDLLKELGRIDKSIDPQGALQQLCSPLAVGVFRFKNEKRRGLATLLFDTKCQARNITGRNVSGVSFIDDIPDEVRKYILIHELGHYFGLCHIDGFHHIMVSGEQGQGDLFTWDTIPGLFLHGGPWFEQWEGEQAWDYIIEHFNDACLSGLKPPDGPFVG